MWCPTCTAQSDCYRLGKMSLAIEENNTTVHTLGRQNGASGIQLHYMKKDGSFSVVFRKTSGQWGLYLVDIFTTLVEIRWRIMLLIFCLSYIFSWLFFGLIYWLIAHVHEDTENPDNAPCVENVRSFTAAFLYSMETQATIGYGVRGMTENCMVAIIVFTVQDVLSCFIDTIVIGIAAAKMASARKRAQTVGFSSCAVVNLRDGALCLCWRLGDFRGNHILEGTATAQLVRHAIHPLGSVVISYHNLDLQTSDIVLATPATIVHRLEPGSPLYSLRPDDLWQENFELVVSFTYTGDTTGITHQTRASYSPADIRWGQRFQDMVKLEKKHYKVDYAFFNQTTWVQVPMVSAEEYNLRIQRVEPSILSAVKRSREGCLMNPDSTEPVFQDAWL